MDMNINAPKVDLEGNAPKIKVNADIPNLDIDFKKPNMEIDGEINPNINLSPKIDLPQGEMDIKGGIPDLNIDLNKEIKVPKIDASLETPKLNDINFKADLPKTKIDIKKPEGNLNKEGELGGKKLNVDMPNIKLNKDDEYFLSGIIPGKDINNLNIKGSRRMQYDYNINQPEVNIKSSKIEFNNPEMNIKGSRRLDFKAPNLNENIKGSRVLYNTQINKDYKISYNKPELKFNSQNTELNSGNKNIKLEKPELKTKVEGELIYSGIIKGKKEYSKNIKLSANIPKPEIKANIEKQDIPKKSK
jgi:hypothetical protein